MLQLLVREVVLRVLVLSRARLMRCGFLFQGFTPSLNGRHLLFVPFAPALFHHAERLVCAAALRRAEEHQFARELELVEIHRNLRFLRAGCGFNLSRALKHEPRKRRFLGGLGVRSGHFRRAGLAFTTEAVEQFVEVGEVRRAGYRELGERSENRFLRKTPFADPLFVEGHLVLRGFCAVYSTALESGCAVFLQLVAFNIGARFSRVLMPSSDQVRATESI